MDNRVCSCSSCFLKTLPMFLAKKCTYLPRPEQHQMCRGMPAGSSRLLILQWKRGKCIALLYDKQYFQRKPLNPGSVDSPPKTFSQEGPGLVPISQADASGCPVGSPCPEAAHTSTDGHGCLSRHQPCWLPKKTRCSGFASVSLHVQLWKISL